MWVLSHGSVSYVTGGVSTRISASKVATLSAAIDDFGAISQTKLLEQIASLQPQYRQPQYTIRAPHLAL
jgi:hypothetical protein